MANLEDAAHFLRGADKILILSHRSPDGDTLGCASALSRALIALGKSVMFRCADPVPPKFTYLFEGIEYGEFEPEHIVTVDVADKTLLGSLEPYGDKTDFAIDHHASCRPFAKETWVEGTAGAACELIARLIPALGAEINRLMFDTKSRAAVALLKRLYGNMEFHCDGKCAVFCLTSDVIAETGASEDDLDGVSAMVRQVEGVLLGFTLREREGGVWKVSMRATNPADASVVCAKFGGGGHKGAAGCSLTGGLEDVKARVVAACGEAIKALENK